MNAASNSPRLQSGFEGRVRNLSVCGSFYRRLHVGSCLLHVTEYDPVWICVCAVCMFDIYSTSS